MDGRRVEYNNGKEEEERDKQEAAEEEDLCGRRISKHTNTQTYTHTGKQGETRHAAKHRPVI